MAHAVELARFASEDEAGMLATRGAAMAAIKAAYPGMIRAILTRMDDGSYLDIVLWESRQDAEAAVAGMAQLPDCAVWLGSIERVLSFEHGEVIDPA